jgi:hypothetical protein
VKDAIESFVETMEHYRVDLHEYEEDMRQLLEQDILNISKCNANQSVIEQETEEISEMINEITQIVNIENNKVEESNMIQPVEDVDVRKDVMTVTNDVNEAEKSLGPPINKQDVIHEDEMNEANLNLNEIQIEKGTKENLMKDLVIDPNKQKDGKVNFGNRCWRRNRLDLK